MRSGCYYWNNFVTKTTFGKGKNIGHLAVGSSGIAKYLLDRGAARATSKATPNQLKEFIIGGGMIRNCNNCNSMDASYCYKPYVN